jgi:multidrug resistance efflux pump
MSVTERFDDTLEPVGIAVGVLLVLVGLATVAGMPWTTKATVAAAAVQVVGAVGTAAIGAGLVWLSRGN